MSAQLDLLSELDGGPVEEPPRDDLEDRADEGSATPSTTAAPAAEEPVVEEAPDTRPERRVSIHALHEERERRKESEAQLNQLRDQAARMEERFAQFQQRWQEQQTAAQEPEVTYEDNPAEYLRQQTEKLQQETEAQRQRQQQQEAMAQQQASYRDFYAKVTSQEQQFAQQATDYYDAVQHLREARAQEYTAAGYAPEQVQAIITQEAHSVAANALRNGRNPAEAFYELAKLRG
jgi:DNA repair exonuclease SbcCD ATPase subunit